MITGRQIRAARGLLDWDASQLADKAGLTRRTVGRIEADLVQAHEKSLASIIHVFDVHGVEFLDDEGLRIRKNQVRTFTGKTGYKLFLDHIYETVKNGGRIRQFNLSDGKTLPYAANAAAAHLQRMKVIPNLDARVLTPHGDTNFPATYCQYRWLDLSNKLLIHYYVYNDFVAQSIFKSDHSVEIVSINSKLLAQRYADQFDAFWDSAKIPPNKKKK
jgi:transcriptional regulator with XRE-family HTH domain